MLFNYTIISTFLNDTFWEIFGLKLPTVCFLIIIDINGQRGDKNVIRYSDEILSYAQKTQNFFDLLFCILPVVLYLKVDKDKGSLVED